MIDERNKMKNWILFKLKTVKRTVNNIERQGTNWEKIFEKHIFDKGLISKYTQNSKLNN